MNTFFLCINPLNVPPDGVTGYIYHYDKPRFFATIQSIDHEGEFKDVHGTSLNIIFLYERGDGLQQLILLVIDQKIDRSANDKLEAALLQAAGWYAGCLARQDAAVYSKSKWSLLLDYNKLTPQLKIIELTSFNKYLLSHPEGIFTFDNADTWIIFSITP